MQGKAFLIDKGMARAGTLMGDFPETGWRGTYKGFYTGFLSVDGDIALP